MDFICLNNDAFDGLTRPRHIICQMLSKRGYRVFYIRSMYHSLFDRITKDYLRFGGVKKYNENLYWILPPLLFLKFYRKKPQSISSYFWRLSLQLFFIFLKVRSPAFFVTVPNIEFIQLIKKFPKSPIIYNVHDRYVNNKGEWIPEHFTLLQMADIVLCGSEFLLDEHKYLTDTKKLRYFPPGVNFELFKTQFEFIRNQPRFHHDKKITLGCIGSFGEQIDWELLNHIADHTNYNFVFVGTIANCINNNTSFKSFKQRTSVQFLSNVCHEEVPALIDSFNVCILPYLKSEYTKGINPLKLLEFLAMGKPIVSAAIPALSDLGTLISIANSKEDWLFALRDLAISDNAEIKTRRIDFARAHDYSHRISFLESILECLKHK